MKTRLFLLVVVLMFSTAVRVFSESEEEKLETRANELAKDVWRASGGESWSKVRELRFTFIVEQDGKEVAHAEHDWDMRAGTDRVKWKGKDVTVKPTTPAQDEDGKAAHARWTNDSYWLLAPLKLLDDGVKLKYEGSKDSEGVACEALRVSFEGVGLTPGDQYVLYIDRQTKMVRAWDYIPKADTVMHGTWEKYETFGDLKLSTEHNFAGKKIRFANIEVKTES